MIDERTLRRWMRRGRDGGRAPQALIEELRRLPFTDVGGARLDTHRRLRRGLPEVVFGEGKTPGQLVRIVHGLVRSGEGALVTRLEPRVFDAIRLRCPNLRYDPVARLAYRPGRSRPSKRGLVVVVTGGTSDLPIAEEAARTLELLGSRVSRIYDAGVAGIHRLLSRWRLLHRARAIVVVAGMEGALASVVARPARCPVTP